MLIRPRLTDHFGIPSSQEDLDFAIPFLEEDIPLFVDPFLLWKSPSYQDKSLHRSLVKSFDQLRILASTGKECEAIQQLVIASECEEVGLGHSTSRTGKKIGGGKAKEILKTLTEVPRYKSGGLTHIEEMQCFVAGISQDRISDFSCSFMKDFLIDFTLDQCQNLGIPVSKTSLPSLYDLETMEFKTDVEVKLPSNPQSGKPLLFVPKRWLRYSSWINYDDYFKHHCPQDEIFNSNDKIEHVRVLNFNRDNYGVVETYIREKERTATDCKNDPLFTQIPVVSAKRRLHEILKLPTGKSGNADKKYEDAVCQLMASLMYPHLDFAKDQSRTDSGVLIRDLVFYNTQRDEFLRQIFRDYGSQQIVMELKNTAKIEREHINQLNRYLAEELGRFGVLITRNPLQAARRSNTIDLWSGQRRAIIPITDSDLEQMVDLYDTKQRSPLDVLKKNYVEFRRACPS